MTSFSTDPTDGGYLITIKVSPREKDRSQQLLAQCQHGRRSDVSWVCDFGLAIRSLGAEHR